MDPVISFVNITRVRPEHGGAACCEAFNEHASDGHSGRLNVLVLPAADNNAQPHRYGGKEGDAALPVLWISRDANNLAYR
ncbi:hypothetical protein MTO96_018705 [Rhipicephalus appendiculatus]